LKPKKAKKLDFFHPTYSVKFTQVQNKCCKEVNSEMYTITLTNHHNNYVHLSALRSTHVAAARTAYYRENK